MSETYILAALEFIIQYGGTLNIHNLWNYMCSKFFSIADFQNTIGKCYYSFKKFLLTNPNLFYVVDDYVYSTDICNVECNLLKSSVPILNSFSDCGNERACISKKLNLDDEAVAVRYFQDHLNRKPEQWVPIKSLAGHLSQASLSIRKCIGSQSEFSTFLMRYPSIFKIHGNLVSLKDKGKLKPVKNTLHSKKQNRPLSLNISTDVNENTNLICPISNNLLHFFKPFCLPKYYDNTLILTLDDFRAITWIVYIIHDKSELSASLTFILSKILHAPSLIKNCVGWTQIELIEFFKKYNCIFYLEENSNLISLKSCKNIRVNIIDRCSYDFRSDTINHQRGCIFCVNRLWGIIDLGFHEHVFFDKSLFKNVTDLTKHFEIKEIVYFNAVIAPKNSRSKWRATCVWKESDQLITEFSQITESRSSDDPDSGLENSEIMLPNDSQILNYSRSIDQHFKEFPIQFQLVKRMFAELNLTDAWNLESYIDDEKLGSSITQVCGSKNKCFNNSLFECFLPSVVDEECNSPSNQSLDESCVSDLNTLAEIPSICNTILRNESKYVELQILNSLIKLTHRPGCCCTCFEDHNQIKHLLAVLKQIYLQNQDHPTT